MSERMAAEIWIGGQIPGPLVPDLCAAIANQGVSLKWGDGQFQPQSAKDLIEACCDHGHGVRVLWLCDDEARWGEFEKLEQFLREHEISFTRRSEGRCGCDPETVEFRPGHEGACLVTNAAGEPIVVASELSPAVNVLAAAIELSEKGSSLDCWSLVKTGVGLLREQLPLALPPLESLEIKQVEKQEGTDGQ